MMTEEKKNIEAYSKTSITEEGVQDVEDQQSDSSEESEDQYQEEVEEEEPSRYSRPLEYKNKMKQNKYSPVSRD